LHRFLFPNLRHPRNLRINLPVRLHQISVVAQLLVRRTACQSARGLAHSKTLRVRRGRHKSPSSLGLRPSAAFPPLSLQTHVPSARHRLKTTPEMAFYMQTIDFVLVEREPAAKTQSLQTVY
jgi:hypothetical protein